MSNKNLECLILCMLFGYFWEMNGRVYCIKKKDKLVEVMKIVIFKLFFFRYKIMIESMIYFLKFMILYFFVLIFFKLVGGI